MNNVGRGAFANIQEFREFSRTPGELVYYHICRASSDRALLEALAESDADVSVILLDIEEDRSFLANTDKTIDITADGVFPCRKLDDCPGLGSWFRGIPLDSVTLPREVPGLVAHARRFSTPGRPQPNLAHADPD